jgi:hypothetical protein
MSCVITSLLGVAERKPGAVDGCRPSPAAARAERHLPTVPRTQTMACPTLELAAQAASLIMRPEDAGVDSPLWRRSALGAQCSERSKFSPPTSSGVALGERSVHVYLDVPAAAQM